MTEKTVTARKDWLCNYCGGDINRGEKYFLEKFKTAKYDKKNDNQIGIEYMQYKICRGCLNNFKKINEKEKKFIEQGHCRECASWLATDETDCICKEVELN